MQRKPALIAVLSLLVAAVVGSSASAAPRDPFLGTWWVIDTTDGSLEQATFGAGGSLFFRDNFASNPTCGGVQAVAKDTGTVSGDTWTGSGTATLRCVGNVGEVSDVFFQFTLNPDGTLSSTATLPTEFWTRAKP
jgi:hypothetical protein